MNAVGSLQLTIFQGKLLRDTEAIGKMDPFATIKLNGQFFTTKVDNDGGKTPSWNQMIEI